MRTRLHGALVALGMLTRTAGATGEIDGIVTLPIKGIQAVQSNDQILFLSENGRFVITGQIYDLWSRTPLTTLSQMQDAATQLHFNRMGIDVDTLNTVTMGHGAKQVVVFVDPRCAVCHRLMQEARALVDDYTFKLIVIPVLGADSNRLAKALYCARDDTQVLDALLTNALDSLASKAICDTRQYDQMRLTANAIGIQGVPLIVAPDGRVSEGRPTHLKSWLESAQ